MATYRIQWQLGGECKIESDLPITEIKNAINEALEGRGEDMAIEFCSDLDVLAPIGYDHNGNATVDRVK